MTIKDIKTSEFAPYYKIYIDKVSPSITLIDGFKIGKKNILQFFEAIPEDNYNGRYATDKWTIKEVLQHLIDTERIFMNRCFRIARNDKSALTGFDQNTYMEPSGAEHKSKTSLLNEYIAVRNCFIALLESLDEASLQHTGTASGGPMSARAAAFIILGHDIWHTEVISEKYL